jgi:hypothetical protein
LILYLMFGAGVAVAVYVRDDAPRGERMLKVVGAWLFWPLFVPALLSRPPAAARSEIPRVPASPDDDLARAMTRVEAELERALRSLDGWAEQTLANERDRLDELKLAWRGQAARIRELSELLDDLELHGPAVMAAESEPGERVAHSEESRRGNIERLSELRRRMEADFYGTLAWVRELATMIHLARYSGAPASRAEELVSQIAAAVEGLSTVASWEQSRDAIDSRVAS